MQKFSTEKYFSIVEEIRERTISADIFSENKNVIFIESTSLQIRKVLELIAYLSVLVNKDKLNHIERNQYRANKIVETLNEKTTLFYPLPSYVFSPKNKDEQPTLIPRGYDHALSQTDFKRAYKFCGEVLHAQHPLKKQNMNIENVFTENKKILEGIKNLLQSHTIGIMQKPNKYTFLCVDINFTSNEPKTIFIREYNTHIFDEVGLLDIFNPIL